jgi:hypothetical protein
VINIILRNVRFVQTTSFAQQPIENTIILLIIDSQSVDTSEAVSLAIILALNLLLTLSACLLMGDTQATSSCSNTASPVSATKLRSFVSL